jgi:hypothetical protein
MKAFFFSWSDGRFRDAGGTLWKIRPTGQMDYLELIQWIRIHPVQTIAETPEYIRRAEKLLDDDERRDLLHYLAAHPRAGDLMEGTGGVRKLRWSRGSRGKAVGCG